MRRLHVTMKSSPPLTATIERPHEATKTQSSNIQYINKSIYIYMKDRAGVSMEKSNLSVQPHYLLHSRYYHMRKSKVPFDILKIVISDFTMFEIDITKLLLLAS